MNHSASGLPSSQISRLNTILFLRPVPGELRRSGKISLSSWKKKKKSAKGIISILSNSLPRFVVVPQKVLDTELKKSFAHFNEGRIPVSMLGFVGHSRVWVLPSKSRPFPVPNVLFQTWCVVLQRWCWRHPRGSDLLRMASFQNNIYHEKDDIRCVCARVRFPFGFFSTRVLFVVDVTGQKLELLSNICGFALTSAPTAANSK